MGRITIAVYRPKTGKQSAVEKLVAGHMDILLREGLVTSRKPIVMKSADGTIVEVFEWKSSEAIAAAHTNQNVGKLWHAFSEVCDFEPPTAVAEFHNMFSEFESVN